MRCNILMMIRTSLLLLLLFGLPLIGEVIAPVGPAAEAHAEESIAAGKQQKKVRLSFEQSINEETAAESAQISLGTFTVTAYCPCRVCCGKWSNPDDPRTASGAPAVEGITVGADWGTIPPGTRIMIAGVGERIVQDKPAAWIVRKYSGRILDLYFEDHAAALAFGRQELEIYILPEVPDHE